MKPGSGFVTDALREMGVRIGALDRGAAELSKLIVMEEHNASPVVRVNAAAFVELVDYLGGKAAAFREVRKGVRPAGIVAPGVFVHELAQRPRFWQRCGNRGMRIKTPVGAS